MITGSMVALVTPMHADGTIDWEGLSRLVDFHLREGTDSIVAVGTTGESATLTVTEHCQVISKIVQQVAGSIPIIAGTGANSTHEALELTQEAKDLGVDACLLVTPYYNKPTQEGMYQHYKYIAERVDIPQILYNVPGRTSVDLLPETVERLAPIDNIVGIKEATGDLERARLLIERCGSQMAIYSGDDPTAVDLILAGGQGNISVTANVAPRQMAEMCRLALAGKVGESREINDRLMPLHSSLFVESNPIPVKWALQEMGLMEGGIRLPLTVLSPASHTVVRNALSACNVLK